jgi:hypothetical protein
MFKNVAFTLITLSFWLTAPFEASAQTKIVTHETSGNLEITTQLECSPISKLSSSHTPADLYAGVAKCFKAANYDHAAQMFAIAGAYGRFDEQRVANTTAHQAIQVLQLHAFEDLDDEVKGKFQDRAREFLSEGTQKFAELPSDIKKIGAPTYCPRHMVQHGMKAFGPAQPNRGLDSRFQCD